MYAKREIMKKLVFFISAFFVLYTNTDAFCAPEIAQWKDTRRYIKPEEWSKSPYNKFVLLETITLDQRIFDCTAQYVAPNLILSAGHCVIEGASYRITGYNKKNVPVKLLDYICNGNCEPATMTKDWALFLIENPQYYQDDDFNVSIVDYGKQNIEVMNAGWGNTRILTPEDLDKIRKDAATYGNFRDVWESNYFPDIREERDDLKASDSCNVLGKSSNPDVYTKTGVEVTVDAEQKRYNVASNDGMFVVDCVVNQGNSGGGIVTKDGRLYGVVSSGLSYGVGWLVNRGALGYISSSEQFMNVVEEFKKQYPLKQIEYVYEFKSQKPFRTGGTYKCNELYAGKAKQQQDEEFEEWKQQCRNIGAIYFYINDKGRYTCTSRQGNYETDPKCYTVNVPVNSGATATVTEEVNEKAVVREKQPDVAHMPGIQIPEDNPGKYIKDIPAPNFSVSDILDTNDTENTESEHDMEQQIKVAENAIERIEKETKIVCDDMDKNIDNVKNMSDYELVSFLNNAVYCEERKETLEKLQKAYDDAKAKEQSLANRALTAATVAATGLGGMELARGLAEQAADKAADKDMAAYIETMRCEYADGKSVKAGPDEIELPGGNNQNLMNYRGEYFALASDLKMRKEALGMKPGIESEEILDKATLGLYDDENVGITGGSEASRYRAQMLGSKKDKSQLDELSASSSKRVKGGAIAAGAGVVGGVLGDSLINGELGKKLKDAFKSKKVGKETESLIKKDTAALDDLKKCLKTAGVQETDKLEFKKFYASVLSVKGIDCKNAFVGKTPNGKNYSDTKASDLFADSTDATAVFNSLTNSFTLANVGKMIGYASLNENNKNLGAQHLNKSMENIKKQYDTAEKKDLESASKLGINLGSVLGNSMRLRDLMSNKDLMSQIGSMVKK